MQLQSTAVLAIHLLRSLTNNLIIRKQNSVIQYMDCITKNKQKKKPFFDYMGINTQPWVTHNLRSLKQLLTHKCCIAFHKP